MQDSADDPALTPIDQASDRADSGALEALGLTGGVSLNRDSTEPVETSGTALKSDIQPKGRYRLSGEIGRGGMGSILKAIDKDLRRPVAMKVMLHDSSEAQRLRFVEEAQITGQLEHPGIVPVHELGIDKTGRLFFTMKLVDGLSLAEIFKRLRADDPSTVAEFTLTKLVRILVDVANAVAFAHHRGVVHRDIKPANLMIGRFGEVLVMDWGLAKVVGNQKPITARRTRRGDSEAGTARSGSGVKVLQAPPVADLVSSQRSASSLNTLVGTVVGTPAYMSPEQARGDTNRITRRSDVYALGALLYEILTLTPPVRGSTAQSTIAQVIAGRIDPPEQRAPTRDIPSELSAVAMKALKAEPHLRYGSVEEFRSDLELFLDGRAVSAKADSSWETIVKLIRRNRAASVAIITGGLLVTAITVFAFKVNLEARHRAEHQEAQATLARAQAETALEEARSEHTGRSKAERDASEALVFEARYMIDEGRYDKALAAIDLALTFDPQSAKAMLLRGQVLMSRHEFERAAQDLDHYLRLQPADKEAQLLDELSKRGLAEKATPSLDAAISAVLAHQGATRLATLLANSLDQQLALFRKQLDDVWPGAGSNISVLTDGGLSLDGRSLGKLVADLSPLRGLPLKRLFLNDCEGIADLSPLKGMPLESLYLDQCVKIADLSPLAGAHLVHLNLRNCPRVTDFSVLKGMPIEDLDLSECRQFNDLALLASMPLRFLALRGCEHVRDLSPLASLNLRTLNIGNTPIADLRPIAKMKELTQLILLQCPITDLSPLAGLTALNNVYLPSSKPLPGLEVLRKLPALAAVDGMPAATYWRKLDSESGVPSSR
jgi:serine/threonine protein kinase